MEFGKKIQPSQTHGVTVEDDRVQGPTWSVQQTDDRYTFEYMSGELAGGIKTHPVSAEDFAALKTGEITDYDLVLKYGLS